MVDSQNTVYSSWNDNTGVFRNSEIPKVVERSKQKRGEVRGFFLMEDFVHPAQEAASFAMCFSMYSPYDSSQYVGTVIVSISEQSYFKLIGDAAFLNSEYVLRDSNGKTYFASAGLEGTLPESIFSDEAAGNFVSIGQQQYARYDATLMIPWEQNDFQMNLYYFVPEQELKEPLLKSYTNLISALLVVGLFFIAVIAYLVIRRSICPLKALSEKMQNYTISQKVEMPASFWNDEISDLNSSFVIMSEHINELVRKTREEAASKERYHYEALMAQLTPHFLFNALNTIRWMALIRNADNIVSCVDSLANLLRYSMNKEGEIVSLKEELLEIESYINMHAFRFGNRIQLIQNIPEEYLQCRVIKLLLLPIVENSVKHGFKDNMKLGVIRVSARREGTLLQISVEDNGAGIEPGRLKAILDQREQAAPVNSVTGIGIHHVNARIKELYGEQYGIDVQSEQEQYTRVILKIPFVLGEDKHEKDFDRG